MQGNFANLSDIHSFYAYRLWSSVLVDGHSNKLCRLEGSEGFHLSGYRYYKVSLSIGTRVEEQVSRYKCSPVGKENNTEILVTLREGALTLRMGGVRGK